MVKEELLELFSQKKLVHLIFFGIVFLDALGAVFPEYLNRKITMFVPFPLILVIYLINTKKSGNKLFLLALGLNFFGIFYFNNPYERYSSIGLVCHAIAYFIYSLIIYRNTKLIMPKKILWILLVLGLLVVVPVKIYSEGMHEMLVFNSALLYVFFGTIYIFMALLVCITKRSKANCFLLFSATSILLSSYFQGYNLFIDSNDLLLLVAVICFNLTHYLMCCYLMQYSGAVEQNNVEQ